MDGLVQRSIEQVRATARTEVPWKSDEPWHQIYHTYQNGGWQACKASGQAPSAKQSFTSLALYSWNIDFMLPYGDSRMSQAIRHLEKLVTAQPRDVATMIYIQEAVKSDLKLLAADPWIQQTFYLTDMDGSNWTSGYYGTVTLVDRRLDVKACFRVHYSQTNMERDAFFTDISLGNNDQTIRFCNTHLESLAFEPALRPPQVALAAKYLREEGLAGGIMAGDFNAIQPFDRHLHYDNGLKDAYLELGGEEDSERGYTWGQQAATKLRQQFGCSRMDKVYYVGGGLQLKNFERFGANVELADAEERKEIVELGFDRPWITDHLGIVARFDIRADYTTGSAKI